jgi:hypothetical protein
MNQDRMDFIVQNEEEPSPSASGQTPDIEGTFTGPLIVANAEYEILRLGPHIGINLTTGKVILSPEADVDEAARLFWDAVERLCPRR